MNVTKLPYPIIRKILSEIDISTFLRAPEIYYYMIRQTETQVEWQYFISRVLKEFYGAETIDLCVLKILTRKNKDKISNKALEDCKDYISTLIKEMRCQRIIKKRFSIRITYIRGIRGIEGPRGRREIDVYTRHFLRPYTYEPHTCEKPDEENVVRVHEPWNCRYIDD